MFSRIALVVLFLLAAAAPAAAAPPPAAAYGAMPALEMVDISQNGQRLALLGRFQGKRSILVVEGTKVLGGINVSDDKVRNISFLGNDKVMVETSATFNLQLPGRDQKAEFSRVGIFDIPSNTLTYVFDHGVAANGVQAIYGFRNLDGHWYGYFGGLTMEGSYLRTGHPDLYKVDLDSGKIDLVERGGRDDHSVSWVIDQQGEIAAHTDYLSWGQWGLRVNGRTAVQVNDPLGDDGAYGLGRTPDSILYALGNDDGADFYEVSVNDGAGAGSKLMKESSRFSIIHDPYSHLLIGFSVEDDDGDTAYTFYDPARQAKIDALAQTFKGRHMSLVSYDETFAKLIVYTDGPKDAGTFWMVDYATGKTSPIGNAYPDVPEDQIGAVSTVTYKAQDGLEIEAVLTLPPGREPKDLPVVVLPHGGPQAYDYPHFDWLAQAFAARGYAVLQPNFRGSSGYGQAFIDAGHGEWGAKMQSDVSDGLAWLAAQGIADPARACVFGASYGGYVAMAAVTLQHGIYRCAVSYAGVSDLVGMVNDEGGVARRYWNEFMGDAGRRKDVSPIRFVDSVQEPLLLIHGKDDTVVPFDQSVKLDKAMRRAGKPVTFIALDGEDHWLSTGKTRTEMLQAAIDFIEKYNPPD